MRIRSKSVIITVIRERSQNNVGGETDEKRNKI